MWVAQLLQVSAAEATNMQWRGSSAAWQRNRDAPCLHIRPRRWNHLQLHRECVAIVDADHLAQPRSIQKNGDDDDVVPLIEQRGRRFKVEGQAGEFL